jgi:hypothetical protein
MIQSLKALLQGEPIEPYNGGQVKPGAVCWAVVPYVQTEFQVIRPVSYNPASADSSKYSLTSKTVKHICTGTDGAAKLPHAALGLRSTEDLVACKVKKRPVVVLTECVNQEDQGFPAHFRGCVLCAPLFTLVDEDGFEKTGYGAQVISRIVALQYRRVFPLPTQPHLDSVLCAIRLDRIASIHVSCLSVPELKISSRWLTFIREWVHYYATGRLRERPRSSGKESWGELLSTAQSLLAEALRQK